MSSDSEMTKTDAEKRTWHESMADTSMWGDYRLASILLGKSVVLWTERLYQHQHYGEATAPWEKM